MGVPVQRNEAGRITMAYSSEDDRYRDCAGCIYCVALFADRTIVVKADDGCDGTGRLLIEPTEDTD